LSFLYRTKWAKVDGILYKPEGAVVLEVADDYPVFGQIESVYAVDGDVLLYVRVMCMLSFKSHIHAYIFKRTSTFKGVMVKKLYLLVVFHVRHFSVSGSPNLVIVPKFHIVRTLPN